MSEAFDYRSVGRLNRAFVGFVIKHPVYAVLTALALLCALLAGVPKVRADFTHRGFFSADDPKLLRFEAFERRFGNDDVITVAVHSPSGIFDPDSTALLRQVTARMWQLPDVVRVDSLTNFNWVHANGDDIVVEPLLGSQVSAEMLPERRRVALAHETLPNYLISHDGNTAVVYAHMRPTFESQADAGAITRAARRLVEEFKRGDNTLYLSGGPPVTYAFEESNKADMRLLPIAVLIAMLFLVGLLRHGLGVGLALVALLLSVAGTFGAAGHLGLVQTALTMTVPSILVCVGIADTVHPLVSFFSAMRDGVERREAARYALTTNLFPTFLTTATTAVGFFSFVTAHLKPIATLGVMAGIGSVLTWVLTQLLTGGLLVLLPIRVKRRAEPDARPSRWASSLIDLVERRRGTIIVVTSLACAATLLYAIGVNVNTDPMKYFRKDAPVRVANDFIEQQLGSARAFEFSVEAGGEDGAKDPKFLAKLDELSSWIERQPGVTRAVSILDVLKATHRALNADRADQYVIASDQRSVAQELFLYSLNLPQGMDLNDRISLKNDAVRLTVLNSIGSSRAAVETVERITRRASDLGLKALGTGKYYLYQDTQDYVVRAFVNSLWSANLAIGVMMVLFLRSLRLGIISIIPNVVPLFAAGALLRLIGQPLDMGTVLVASVTLGISVDDTSHVLANFAALRRQGVAAGDALRRVFAHSGPALLSTNAILILAFASFATATFVPNVFFGVLTSFTLLVAVLADALLTPALLLIGIPRREAVAEPRAVPAE